MANPTDPNDSVYKNNPDYVWSGGRWQWTGNKSAPSNAAPGPTSPTKITAEGGKLPFDPTPLQLMPANMENVGITGYERLQNRLNMLANLSPRENPFRAEQAIRNRGAQLALLDQIRAAQGGPSIAGMQAQGALGQNAQQALMAAASGQRGTLGQARMVGSGIAGDAGQSRLKEYLQGQALLGAGVGKLRGDDLSTAGTQAEMGARQLAADEMFRRGAATTGASLYGAQADLAREADKINVRRVRGVQGAQDKAGQDWLEFGKFLAQAGAKGG